MVSAATPGKGWPPRALHTRELLIRELRRVLFREDDHVDDRDLVAVWVEGEEGHVLLAQLGTKSTSHKRVLAEEDLTRVGSVPNIEGISARLDGRDDDLLPSETSEDHHELVRGTGSRVCVSSDQDPLDVLPLARSPGERTLIEGG